MLTCYPLDSKQNFHWYRTQPKTLLPAPHVNLSPSPCYAGVMLRSDNPDLFRKKLPTALLKCTLHICNISLPLQKEDMVHSSQVFWFESCYKEIPAIPPAQLTVKKHGRFLRLKMRIDYYFFFFLASTPPIVLTVFTDTHSNSTPSPAITKTSNVSGLQRILLSLSTFMALLGSPWDKNTWRNQALCLVRSSLKKEQFMLCKWRIQSKEGWMSKTESSRSLKLAKEVKKNKILKNALESSLQ